MGVDPGKDHSGFIHPISYPNPEHTCLANGMANWEALPIV
jgi:hypothetical protein